VIALFAAVRFLIQSEQWLWKYWVFTLVLNGSWSSLFYLVGERWSYLKRLILLEIERIIRGGWTLAVSISSVVELMGNLLINWERTWINAARLNDRMLLVTKLMMRRKWINDGVVLKMLIL
jgi:hypothetical protein